MPTSPLDRAQLVLHLLAQLQVERAERLVEQQHARPVHERARERHALALAARELARCGASRSRPAAPCSSASLGAPAALLLADLRDPQPVFHVLAHASCGETARSPGRRCSRRARRAGGRSRRARPALPFLRQAARSPRSCAGMSSSPSPTGPSSVKNSSSRMSRSTRSTATTSPYVLRAPSRRTATSPFWVTRAFLYTLERLLCEFFALICASSSRWACSLWPARRTPAPFPRTRWCTRAARQTRRRSASSARRRRWEPTSSAWTSR